MISIPACLSVRLVLHRCDDKVCATAQWYHLFCCVFMMCSARVLSRGSVVLSGAVSSARRCNMRRTMGCPSERSPYAFTSQIFCGRMG